MPKLGGTGWPGAGSRGGGAAGIRRCEGGDGADMRGPHVSGRRERRRVDEKAQLKRESVNK
jgi:hypothetical protein